MQDLANQLQVHEMLQKSQSSPWTPLQPAFPPTPDLTTILNLLSHTYFRNYMLYIIHNMYLTNLYIFSRFHFYYILLLKIYTSLHEKCNINCTMVLYKSPCTHVFKISKPWNTYPAVEASRPPGSVSSTLLSYCQIVLQKGCVNSHSLPVYYSFFFSTWSSHSNVCPFYGYERIFYCSFPFLWFLMRQHFQVYLSLELALALIIY